MNIKYLKLELLEPDKIEKADRKEKEKIFLQLIEIIALKEESTKKLLINNNYSIYEGKNKILGIFYGSKLNELKHFIEEVKKYSHSTVIYTLKLNKKLKTYLDKQLNGDKIEQIPHLFQKLLVKLKFE